MKVAAWPGMIRIRRGVRPFQKAKAPSSFAMSAMPNPKPPCLDVCPGKVTCSDRRRSEKGEGRGGIYHNLCYSRSPLTSHPDREICRVFATSDGLSQRSIPINVKRGEGKGREREGTLTGDGGGVCVPARFAPSEDICTAVMSHCQRIEG